MRRPSGTLVVDASILISATLGRSGPAIVEAGLTSVLVTTDRAVEETRRRLVLGLERTSLLPVMEALLDEMDVAASEGLGRLVADAEMALREAPASRNGSTRDAHLLALAWAVEGDIWSYDRDFAGTGVATWSTPNLMRALSEA